MCKLNLQSGIACMAAAWNYSVLFFMNIRVGRQENVLINSPEMCQIIAYLENLLAQSNGVNIWLTSSEA